jgi:hypothetical protein
MACRDRPRHFPYNLCCSDLLMRLLEQPRSSDRNTDDVGSGVVQDTARDGSQQIHSSFLICPHDEQIRAFISSEFNQLSARPANPSDDDDLYFGLSKHPLCRIIQILRDQILYR